MKCVIAMMQGVTGGKWDELLQVASVLYEVL